MKLIILTTTMLLSILAGSLSVSIVSWATSPSLAMYSQAEGSTVCGDVFAHTSSDTSGWLISRGDADRFLELSSENASLRGSAPWGCTVAGAALANGSAFVELQAAR